MNMTINLFYQMFLNKENIMSVFFNPRIQSSKVPSFFYKSSWELTSNCQMIMINSLQEMIYLRKRWSHYTGVFLRSLEALKKFSNWWALKFYHFKGMGNGKMGNREYPIPPVPGDDSIMPKATHYHHRPPPTFNIKGGHWQWSAFSKNGLGGSPKPIQHKKWPGGQRQ